MLVPALRKAHARVVSRRGLQGVPLEYLGVVPGPGQQQGGEQARGAAPRDDNIQLTRARHGVVAWPYSVCIQLSRSCWLTDLSSAGWSLAMCPRIIPTTWSSLSALATYPHSHLMSFIVVPPYLSLALLPA
jgi:hypothetical protein